MLIYHFTSCCTGQNTHSLLHILVKHLDHKAVVKQQDMQLNIVKVATNLAEQSKAPTSTVIISAMADLLKHLQKSMRGTGDDEDVKDESVNKLRTAVDECLVQLSQKVFLMHSNNGMTKFYFLLLNS